MRHELTAEQMDKLATITPYATGATIKDLVPVLAAPGPRGWLVAPDPDPLNTRDHGNGSGPANGSGPSGGC